MKRYLLSWLILTFFAVTGCKAPKQEVLGEITFWAVDQSGNAVQNAKITYGDETLTTDESGKVLIKLNVGMALNARIKAEKENYVFLGPEKVTSLNPDLRSVVLTLFGNYTFTASARKDGSPFPDVSIFVDGKEYITRADGTIETITFSGERSDPIIIAAKSNAPKLKPPRIFPNEEIQLDQYDLSRKPYYFYAETIPDSGNGGIIKPQQAELVITADHGASFTVEGKNLGSLPRHKINIRAGQEPVVVRSPDTGVRIQINFSGVNIQGGKNYRCKVNFLTKSCGKITLE